MPSSLPAAAFLRARARLTYELRRLAAFSRGKNSDSLVGANAGV